MKEKEIYGGLVRLHVLHHASRERVFGLGIMEELAHHGYRLSPGTLYPVLHGLERSGLLASTVEKAGGRNRRTYVATKEGRKALRQAKGRVWELFRELFEEELSQGPPRKAAGRGKSTSTHEG
ncbi:MAG: PadR family transcriptional regulator [Burkholderiales bacterium]